MLINISLKQEENIMAGIHDLWLKFNQYSNELSKRLGRTKNILGEYSEYLANQYYKGNLLDISNSSADIKTEDGTLYQVKARKLNGSSSTQLSVIRSWDFDYLIVFLFKKNGALKIGLEVPVEVAKHYASRKDYENGWVITTTQDFITDDRSSNITDSIKSIIKN